MAVNTPTTWTDLVRGNFFPGESIVASERLALGNACNTAFRTAGSRFGGQVFDINDDGNEYRTNSVSFTQANSNGDTPLSACHAGGRLLRRIEVAGTPKYRVALKSYGFEIRVRATVYAVDTNVSLGSVTNNHTGATGTVQYGVLDIAAADAHEGGSTANPKRMLAIRAEAVRDDESTGSLWYWSAREGYAETADMPTKL